MGTLTEEIFRRRLGRRVHAGEIVVAPVDYAMAHDVTGPLAIEAFRKLDVPLWDAERVIMVFDHILPANTVAAAASRPVERIASTALAASRTSKPSSSKPVRNRLRSGTSSSTTRTRDLGLLAGCMQDLPRWQA